MSEHLGRVLKHPLRRRLLLEYITGPASPADLARRLDRPLNSVAYHTSVLARHACIELVRTERRHGGERRVYRATISPEIDGEGWESLSVTVRRALTLGVMDQATDEARQAVLGGGFDGPETHLSRSPLLLDDEGLDAVATLLRDAFRELGAIVGDAASRDDATRHPHEIVLLAYQRPSGVF